MKDPSKLFRAAVIGGQFGFGLAFLTAYMISPAFCHRFVGYIEEEACSTYTKIIEAIENAPDGSELAQWKYERAPKIAISYWKLGEEGTVLDLMRAVRADEAEHRDVNHLVCGMKPGQTNPLYDPQAKLDQMLLKYAKDMMTASDGK
jgi:Alternative oxidase